jgi:hypothetical protein
MIKYLILFLFILSTEVAAAQFFEHEIKTINNTIPSESIFIHFDRAVYTPGDTIWFKAYIRQGVFPSGASTTLFVELFDANGKVLNRNILPVLYYSAQGFFVLPDSIPACLIAVRAYTPFMATNIKSGVYQHFLPVIAEPSDVIVPVKENNKKPSIEFFPQGGNLIANTECLLAFKAVDENGQPVSVTGYIKNNQGDTLADFKTQYDGLGSFILKASNEELTAEWWVNQQLKYTTVLPAPKSTATIEIAKTEKGDYKFRVVGNPYLVPDKTNYYLLVYSTGTALFEAAIDLKRSSVSTGVILSDSLPAGVINFMLLDEKKNIVAQRCVYHLLRNQISNILISKTPMGFEKRQLNTIELSMPDEEFTNMSIAVYDADLPEDSFFSSNILERFLLNAEFPKTVNDTQNYFTKRVIETDTYIDLLMLTTQWKNAWSNTSLTAQETVLPEGKFIQLKGKVTGLTNEELTKAGKLNLLFTSGDSIVQLLPVDILENGSIVMDNLVFFDSAKLSFYFDSKPKRKFEIEIEPPFVVDKEMPSLKYPGYNKILHSNTQITKQSRSYKEQNNLLQKSRYKVLNEIVVTGRKKTREDILDETYTTGQFRNDRAFRFDIINDPYFNTYNDIVSYLRGKVPGLQISQGALAGADLQISWRAQPTLVYVDEQYVFTSTLLNIPIDQIAYVKVFRPVFFGLRVVTEFEAKAGVVTHPSANENAGNMKPSEFFGSGGAIAVYTKRNYAVEQKKSVIPVTEKKSFVFKGYTSTPQFFNPDYEIESFDSSWIDIRKTLYWNPVVLTGGDIKKFAFQFYNNDLCKAFKLVVQGMRADGKLVWFEQVYK